MKAEEKRLIVRVPKELHEAAKIKAARTGISMTRVCREALEKWVKENNSHEEPQTA